MRPEPARLHLKIGERVSWVSRGSPAKSGTVKLIVPPGANPRRVLQQHFGSHAGFEAFRVSRGVVVRLYQTYIVEVDRECRSNMHRVLAWQSDGTLHRIAG